MYTHTNYCNSAAHVRGHTYALFCVFLFLVTCLPVAGSRSSVAAAMHPVAGTYYPVAGVIHSVAGVVSPVAGTCYPVAGVIHSVAGVIHTVILEIQCVVGGLHCVAEVTRIYSVTGVAIATATISNSISSVMCHAGNVDVISERCEAPCLFHALIIMLPVYRNCKCLPNLIHISHWGCIILT